MSICIGGPEKKVKHRNDQRLANATRFAMPKRAREEIDFCPQHQALGNTGHVHATSEAEVQRISLTKEALADHAAAHLADLISAALTKMAMLHERNVVFAEALYEFQESFEYFRTVFSRATESLPDLPLDLSDTDAFVKSNEYVSAFLPWLRRFKKDYSVAKDCLVKFKEAQGQFMGACVEMNTVPTEIRALEFAFPLFDRVSRLRNFHRRFIAKVQIQMSKNVQAVSQFLGTMDTNNLFLRVQSEISCREYLLRKLLSLPVVQQIPEVALKEQEEPELSCASLPDDGISPNTPSSVASGQCDI